jgi:SAM-dependent methyltransferase
MREGFEKSDCNSLCPACGNVLEFLKKESPICRELARDWNLSKSEWGFFSRREGSVCKSCGLSARLLTFSEALAVASNRLLGTEYKTFRGLAKKWKFRWLKIANISGCGMVSPLLARACWRLSYSEYFPENSSVRHEDIMRLTYGDNHFDLVVNSDVLEHVPDYKRALHEISRILKDDGYFVFTVPVIWGRATKQRAKVDNGRIVHLESPSYHGQYSLKKPDYLVFWEFGDDFMMDLKKIFKSITVYCRDEEDPLMCAFICGNSSDEGVFDNA